jgi:hypothetical protein
MDMTLRLASLPSARTSVRSRAVEVIVRFSWTSTSLDDIDEATIASWCKGWVSTVTRWTKKSLTVVAASLVTTLGLATLASATSTSGDAQAIAQYSHAVAASNARPVLRDTSTDTYFLQDNITTLTNPASFSYILKAALPATPAGFVRARTITTFRLVNGIVKWSTTLVLPECTTTSACKDSVGLEFYDTPSREDVALLNGPAKKYCWAQSEPRSSAQFAFTANQGVWSVDGKFSPVKKVADRTLFVSRYSYNGIPVTEDDYLSNATHLFVKSVYHYAATGSTQADTIVTNESDPATVPAPPSLPSCAS